jgi:hypothetical protein
MKKGKITFYIGSERFARVLASHLRYNIGGLLKETYKSGSRKIPKEVKLNRLYISLYLNPFIEGDLVGIKDIPRRTLVGFYTTPDYNPILEKLGIHGHNAKLSDASHLSAVSVTLLSVKPRHS